MKITKLKIENFQRSLLQTPEWSSFKSRHGWRSHQVDGWFVLERSLPLGQRFLYAPELTLDPKSLPKFLGQVRQLARQRRAFVIRFEWMKLYISSDANYLKSLGLRKAFEEVQPEFRQWIDLAGNEDEILARMKPKGRYNIRLSERSGVTVDVASDPAAFVELFADTARRQGFTTRAMSYYTDLIHVLHSNDLGALVVARFKDRPLAALIVTWYQGLATYLYGASSDEQRNLMAPHLAHWQAIKLAKQHDCSLYDLLAVAPNSGEEQRTSPGVSPGSPRVEGKRDSSGVGSDSPDGGERRLTLQIKYAGITRFKQQFGGDTVHLLGSWDLILNPLVYQGFKFLETHRR